MRPETKILYSKATKSALENAYDIFEEASVLYEFGHYQRAFALGILTAEEIAKSYIYRSISIGFLDPSNTGKVTTDHEEKLYHFQHLLFFIIALADYSKELTQAMDHDKGKPHSEHTLMGVYDKIGNKAINVIQKNLINAHNLKLDSIYVGIRNNKIIEPKTIIDQTKCDELFILIGKALPVSKLLLNFGDEVFKKTIKDYLPNIQALAKEQDRDF